ncbi:glycosyltransferase [Sulfurovum sp.]|uniref:glycosyltransferase n=1 Tax=Sulfurovum sp. TaxID=1969726 RepID=UPI00356AB15E
MKKYESNQMKLNVVIPSFFPAVIYGGPIFTSLHTAEELAKIGVDVRVSTTNANKGNKLDVVTNIWQVKESKLSIKYYNESIVDKFSFPLLFSLWQDITEADVVHVQALFSTPVPIALIYSKLFKKRVLLTPHGTLGQWCLTGGSRFKMFWLKWLIKPFNSITVWHATAEKEKLEILSVFPDVDVHVIANGIKVHEFENFNVLAPKDFVKKFAPSFPEKGDVQQIVISMGRLQKVKGFDTLIDSFNNILEKHKNAKLFIAGQDEGEEDNLRKKIRELGLKHTVFLVGQISGQDKIDFFANADLFVLPSHNENFGLVYAESLAAGTPIVASKNTPWSEVEEADCGKWVNNSVEETTQAMIEMLGKDRELMRANSKKLAQKYDWKNIAIQFKSLFEKMINDK